MDSGSRNSHAEKLYGHQSTPVIGGENVKVVLGTGMPYDPTIQDKRTGIIIKEFQNFRHEFQTIKEILIAKRSLLNKTTSLVIIGALGMIKNNTYLRKLRKSQESSH